MTRDRRNGEKRRKRSMLRHRVVPSIEVTRRVLSGLPATIVLHNARILELSTYFLMSSSSQPPEGIGDVGLHPLRPSWSAT